MTALIVDHAGGRCDSRCHEALHAGCDCICGGSLHGAGSSTAAQVRLQGLVAGGMLGERPAMVMRDLWDRVERVEVRETPAESTPSESPAVASEGCQGTLARKLGTSACEQPAEEGQGTGDPSDKDGHQLPGSAALGGNAGHQQAGASPAGRERDHVGTAPLLQAAVTAGRDRLCGSCGKYRAGGPWVKNPGLCAKCRGVAP